jgi:hypothetical protein
VTEVVGGLRRPRGLDPASLMFYDVSTVDCETDQGGHLPRVRLLQGTASRAADHDRPADQAGRIPLAVNAFQGNRPRPRPILPGNVRSQEPRVGGVPSSCPRASNPHDLSIGPPDD